MKYRQLKTDPFIDINTVVSFEGKKQTYLVVEVRFSRKGNLLFLTERFNRRQFDCTKPVVLQVKSINT